MGKNRRLKKPDVAKGTRILTPIPEEGGDQQHVVFCLRRMKRPYDWEKFNSDRSYKLLVDCLVRRSNFTWSELKLQPRDKLGYELGDKISFSPDFPFPNEMPLIFRIGRKGRLIGFRESNVLVVV